MTITADRAATQVRQATSEELPALARVLTRAFADDPVTAWLWPDESSRVERLARFFSDVFMERLAPGRDEIFTDDDLRGVASWTPPGQGDIAPLEMLRLLPLLASVCGSRLPRGAARAGLHGGAVPAGAALAPAVLGRLARAPGPRARRGAHAPGPRALRPRADSRLP